MTEIVELCTWISHQHEIKVVIMRGEGRAFTAGFDLNDFTNVYGGSNPRAGAELGRVADTVTNMRQLTIAAVHGHCVGGGVVLTAACDLRMAATGTRFSIPEVDLEFPSRGGVPRLVREVGQPLRKSSFCRADRFLLRRLCNFALSTAWSPMTNSLQRPRLSPNRWRANPHFRCSQQRHRSTRSWRRLRVLAGARTTPTASWLRCMTKNLGPHLSAISNLDLDRLATSNSLTSAIEIRRRR